MGMLLHCESDKMHKEKLIFFSALTEVTTIFSSCLHNLIGVINKNRCDTIPGLHHTV